MSIRVFRSPIRILMVVVLATLLAPALPADERSAGKISGLVLTEDGGPLPGATVTLTGAGLIASSVTQTSNEGGSFRFLNLTPGDYTVTISMPGFATQQIGATVRVGQTTSVEKRMAIAGTREQVTVRGQAPLIDKTSPQLATNYNTKQIEQLPNSRSYIDIIENAPTVTDRSAYGAGGNVDGYDKFGFGAATNTYSLNGVLVSNLEFGNTWVNPNYDTVAEIQIVGPGASAEYGSFTGAAVNVVTKAGTNDYHGGVSAWYTNDKLVADNSHGIADLAQNPRKYDAEGAVHLGGPIVKEKLLFFVSGAYYASAEAPFKDPNRVGPNPYIYNDHTRQSYQLRLDYLMNTSNQISGMYNRDPIDEVDDGLLPGAGREIGYVRLQNTNTAYVSWQSVWNASTATEVKYAGVNGHNYRQPNAPLTIPAVYDYRVGLKQYNSTGFVRNQTNARHEGIATATRYVDNFLNASHDIKAGVEYEYAKTKTNFKSSGNMFLYIFPYDGPVNYLLGIVNYNSHQRTRLQRPGAFLQDNIRIGRRLTANVGVRYDRPDYIDQNTDETLLKFNNWSPRLGVSYDFTGDGKTVAHASWGRFYDKAPTYGPGFYTGTGNTPISYYSLFTDAPVDPSDWQSLRDLIVRPENLFLEFTSSALPVIGDPKNPKSDVWSLGIERQFGNRLAVALNYIQKKTNNFLGLIDLNADQVIYEPFTFASPLNGRDVTVFRLADGSAFPAQDAFGPIDKFEQNQKLLTLEVRSNPTEKLALNASVTYEDSTGTHDNNECAVLSLCTNYHFNNPNYFDNRFAEGELSAVHKWQGKLNGFYAFPWEIQLGASFRWLSGAPWGATTDAYRVAGLNQGEWPGFDTVRLEPKDARHQNSSALLDLQLGKVFQIAGVSVTPLVTVLNVFNESYQAFDYYNNNINATYTYERNPDGSPASSFGKPQGFFSGRPRETRFGLRVTF